MADDTYDLAELCDLADVTPRTVRYYVQQGLLPAPAARGPGAHYDRGHRDRLRLIKRLQREHLPLAEIRARLAALDDAAVAALLAEPGQPSRHGSALEYVREVLAGRQAQPAPPMQPAPSARSGNQVRLARMAPRRLAEPADAADAPPWLARPPAPATPADATAADERAEIAGAQAPTRSTWERIALGPDVELHVRRPLSRPQNRMVERLVAFARSLFADPD